ncbi:POT-type proton-dependent oligopeptide transporter, partial [Francisella tularensis]|uniref:POT-type proton-dependent oligopeptide transporter n=1 Tax=Francisella tularensis TaxID=263 RepID=UPI0023AD6D8C|nr:MFS transporter [Francisella tularensis subsp. holarctica]
APMLCGLVAHYYCWHYGFGIAGLGMIFGLAVFMLGSNYIPDVLPQKTLSKQLHNFFVVFRILLILNLIYLDLEYLFDG